MKILKHSIIFLLIAILVNQIQADETFAIEKSKDSVKPSKKDAIAIMKGVCGKNNIKKNSLDVCQTCPSFTGTNSSEGLALTTAIYGSFTKFGISEAVIDLEGCQPHAHNWGGSALIRKINQRWSLIQYKAGLRSEKCQKFKGSNSRHQLVCEASYIGHGYKHTWLESVKFNSNKIATSTLLTTVSNEGTCTPPYYAVKIVDFLAQDVNKDGKKDLLIKVSEAREGKNINRSDDNRCKPHLPKPKFYQMTFLFDGQSFHPTAETAKIKKRLEALKNN